MFTKLGTRHFINVKIEESNTCRNAEERMSQEEFEKCVDDKIQDEFSINNISCVPPWLTNKNQCDKTYPDSSSFFGPVWNDFTNNYIDMVGILSNIR